MLVFQIHGRTTTSSVLQDGRFINTEENLTAMLNFSSLNSIEAIDAVFPFLARCEEERILNVDAEPKIDLGATGNTLKAQRNDLLEYRKGLFFGYANWMASIWNLYAKVGAGKYNSLDKDHPLIRERKAIFSAAKNAAIAKIDIIRSTQTSSNLINIEEFRLSIIAEYKAQSRAEMSKQDNEADLLRAELHIIQCENVKLKEENSQLRSFMISAINKLSYWKKQSLQ
jgi:hypothetical protein